MTADEPDKRDARTGFWQIPGFARVRQILLHTLANVLVVYCTLFFGWTLFEVLTVYTGEWLLLVLVVYARVIVARRMPADAAGASRTGSALLASKVMVFFVTLPFYVICLGIFGFAISAALEADTVPASSLQFVLICLAAFFVTHLLTFIRQAKAGAFDELINDRIVLIPFWRFPLLLVVLVIALFMQDPQFEYGPTAFVIVVTLIAIVNTVLQRIDLDYVEARIERLDRR